VVLYVMRHLERHTVTSVHPQQKASFVPFAFAA
jgi:hypothetical protein